MSKRSWAVGGIAAGLAGTVGCLSSADDEDEGALGDEVQALDTKALGRGTIQANPSVVVLYPGQNVAYTTVSWNAYDVTTASMSGAGCGGFGLFGFASCPLGVGQSVTYFLYGDNRLLSTTFATAVRATGTITATPRVVDVGTGTACSTRLGWWSTYLSSGSGGLRVDGATAVSFAGGVSGTVTAPWIQAGHTYRFTLRAGATANGVVMASVLVTGRAVAPAADPEPGSWWNPARSGNGLDLRVAGDTLYMTWMTYDAAGTPRWYLGALARGPGAWRGDISRYTWNGTSAAATVVGTATITLSSSSAATFAWTLGAASGSEPIERVVFGGTGSAPSLSGLWYVPGNGGWGLNIDTQGDVHVAYLTVYDASGQPTWVYGVGTGAGPSVSFGLTGATGVNLCPGCTGPTSVTTWSAGSLVMDNTSVTSGTAPAWIDASLAGGTWSRPGVTLARLIGP